MTDRIQRALLSVSDKSGIVELARAFHELGIEILSTGGTQKTLENSGVPVRSVSDYTGFPEMMDGRVKTLHPKIHAGLLALRDNLEHMQEVDRHGIELIDMVVVNLYPFRETISKDGVRLDGARRPLRVPLTDPSIDEGEDERGHFLRLFFQLPPGAYATNVAREICKSSVGIL